MTRFNDKALSSMTRLYLAKLIRQPLFEKVGSSLMGNIVNKSMPKIIQKKNI